MKNKIPIALITAYWAVYGSWCTHDFLEAIPRARAAAEAQQLIPPETVAKKLPEPGL